MNGLSIGHGQSTRVDITHLGDGSGGGFSRTLLRLSMHGPAELYVAVVNIDLNALSSERRVILNRPQYSSLNLAGILPSGVGGGGLSHGNRLGIDLYVVRNIGNALGADCNFSRDSLVVLGRHLASQGY